MNTFLIILGLTIIYYAVLFRLDKRRKAAFQKEAQQAIGQTTIPSIINQTTTDDIFGPTTKEAIPLPKETISITQPIEEGNTEFLKTKLEEMVQEVEAEKDMDFIENKELKDLANNTETINEKQLTDLVDNISKPISRKTTLKPKASF